jgi:predicted nucleic acid-binding protein
VFGGGDFSGLETQRQRIGIPKIQIAAVAMTNGLTLVTAKHFQRVIDLGYPMTLENWRNP